MDIKEMEDYASKYNIPIMEKEGIEFLTKYIKDNNIKSILEIGTAIGYSAIRMCNVSSDITVTTIERDKERFDIAVNNIKANNLNDRITAIFGDALEVNLSGKYDLIFIDAAKAQSIKFFTKYIPLLNEDGTIITDNINFHGLTFSKDPAPTRNLRQLTRKINFFIKWLEDTKEYTSKYINIGDGLMISKRVEK